MSRLITLNEELESIVEKYNLQNIAGILKEEYAISKNKDLQEALSEIETDGRVLKIGMVGRVKAGKSSLLNSLIFNGESVLPKAATPMTAALTILEYADETKATVEFFKKEDINNIKKEHARYIEELEKAIQDEFIKLQEKNKNSKRPKHEEELKEKTQKKVTKSFKSSHPSLYSSWDQYELIKKCGLDIENIEPTKEIIADSVESLNRQLEEYVGAKGKFMPFTKSVTLYLQQANLKDVQIIDTPGVNDPVISREERTKELLKYCDVIFIVSPSGQFLSSDDIDLFDRITSKEGIKEIYLVASKVDGQLFGSVKIESGGILNRALENIVTVLTKQTKKVFETDADLKDLKVFANLLKKDVLYSSGICHSIFKKFDNKENFDENEAHVWKNLQGGYKDFFNDDAIAKTNLKLLANMENIQSQLDEVKVKKDTILNERKESFEKNKIDALQNYKNKLIKEINSKIKTLEDTDINELKQKQKSMQSKQQNASVVLDNEYEDIINILDIDLTQKLTTTLNGYFKATKDDINDAEGSETETKYYTVHVSGDWYNPFSWGGHDETRTRTSTYTTARAGMIRNSIDELTDNIESTIDTDAKKELNYWKKNIAQKTIIKTLRETLGDENVDILILINTIKQVLNAVEYPDISYSGELPSELRKSGTLTGSSAERFLSDAQEYVAELKTRVKKDIKNYIKSLTTSLKDIDISNKIFKQYESQMQELENAIKNKELSLEKYNKIIKDLEVIHE